MNTDTHFNKGGGGAAYKTRTGGEQIQPGDRVRTYAWATGLPVYATVVAGPEYDLEDDEDVYLLALDNGIQVSRLSFDIQFHGRPHAAFNKGDQQ